MYALNNLSACNTYAFQASSIDYSSIAIMEDESTQPSEQSPSAATTTISMEITAMSTTAGQDIGTNDQATDQDTNTAGQGIDPTADEPDGNGHDIQPASGVGGSGYTTGIIIGSLAIEMIIDSH